MTLMLQAGVAASLVSLAVNLVCGVMILRSSKRGSDGLGETYTFTFTDKSPAPSGQISIKPAEKVVSGGGA